MGERKDLAHIPRTAHNATQLFCLKCLLHVPKQQFSKNSSTPTGYASWCKRCTSTYYKAKRKAKHGLTRP